MVEKHFAVAVYEIRREREGGSLQADHTLDVFDRGFGSIAVPLRLSESRSGGLPGVARPLYPTPTGSQGFE